MACHPVRPRGAALPMCGRRPRSQVGWGISLPFIQVVAHIRLVHMVHTGSTMRSAGSRSPARSPAEPPRPLHIIT